MILDSLKNRSLYYGVAPRLERAFDFIMATDWSSLEAGIHELDGRDIFVNIIDCELKSKSDAPLEVHNDYIDIQVLISGEEEAFGWSERKDVQQPTAEFNTEKDVQFFNDTPQTYYTVRPSQFTILLPEDAHAPMVGEGEIRKIIVKVRIN